jgi:hypothetical protein
MIYSEYFQESVQSSKWDRMRIDYDLVLKVIQAKERENSKKSDVNPKSIIKLNTKG